MNEYIEYMDDWEQLNEKPLLEKEDCHLYMEDIT